MALRALVLAAGWWTLTDGAATVFGAVVALLALAASISLVPDAPPTWHPLGVVRFLLAFLGGSVRGGIDVAHRAMAPRMRIDPRVLQYTLRLPEGSARDLLLGTISLMPGTLSIACEGQRLDVHVLAARSSFISDLAALEATVARATGQHLEESRA